MFVKTMSKKILTISILFISFISFGQTQKVIFNTITNDDDCSTILKVITLYKITNKKDSIILKDTSKICFFDFDIPDLIGKYHLSINSEKYETLDVFFEIPTKSSNYIDLKTVLLKKKINNLDEVTISGIKRSFIKIDADKTTIQVRDNPILTVSTVYDAIIKIPGIIPSPDGGFSAYGKGATVYFEGIPGNLSGSDLTNLLKSLPATSVEKIEIISNPGASYDANVSGAIINIVSLAKVTKWISGTVNMNYGLNSFNKAIPSIVLSGKNKKISWQFQSGLTYFERSTKQNISRTFTSFSPIIKLNNSLNELAINQFYYLKPTVNFQLNSHSNLIINYNLTTNQKNNNGVNTTTSEGLDSPINLKNNYNLKGSDTDHNVVLKYRNTIDTLNRVFEITANYFDYSGNQLTKSNQNENEVMNFSLLKYTDRVKSFYIKTDLEIPFNKRNIMLKIGAKYNNLLAKSTGSYNLQNQSSAIFQNLNFTDLLDFNYIEDNLAGYVEVKKEIKKLALGAGFRVENFTLNRRSTSTETNKNNYLNIFPSANAIYRFSPDMNIIGSYSRKIALPTYEEFDPNNSNYYDNYSSSSGNLLLKPNFFDNLELKFSVFDYLQLSVNYSHSQTLNLDQINVKPNSLQTVNSYRTYHNVNSLTYFFSIPIPFGVFRDGLQFFNNPIDIDQINYMYLYTERTTTSISDYTSSITNKAMWNHGLYSQFILPFKIRMNVDYWLGTKGTYQIYNITQPQTALEIVLSKDFMKKKLKTSISFQDIFNQLQFNNQLSFDNLNINFHNKNDTRIIWFKVAYSFGQFQKNEENQESVLDNIDSNKKGVKL